MNRYSLCNHHNIWADPGRTPGMTGGGISQARVTELNYIWQNRGQHLGLPVWEQASIHGIINAGNSLKSTGRTINGKNVFVYNPIIIDWRLDSAAERYWLDL